MQPIVQLGPSNGVAAQPFYGPIPGALGDADGVLRCAPGQTYMGYGQCVGRAIPLFGRDDIHGGGQLSPSSSEGVVFEATPISYGVLCALALLLMARNVRLARRPSRPDRFVARGTVTATTPGQPALRVELRQQGREFQNKGQWSHQWREVSRSTFAQPFELRLENGDALRVEPDERTLLVGALAETHRHEHTLRTRVASVKVGDEVYVEGTTVPTGDPRAAQFGYRGSAQGQVLRAPARGRLVVSREPLEQRFARRARLHKRWAIAFVSVFLATNALLYMGFWVRTAVGQQIDTVLDSKRTFVTRSRNSTTTHYELTVTDPSSGATLVEEVNYPAYQLLQPGDHVPFVRVGEGHWFTTPGLAPTVHLAGVIVSVMLGLGVSIGYLAHGLSSRPWYARRRHHEAGGGRL